MKNINRQIGTHSVALTEHCAIVQRKKGQILFDAISFLWFLLSTKGENTYSAGFKSDEKFLLNLISQIVLILW